MSPLLSIVVPAHNERGCIPLLCIEIDKTLEGMFDYEVILVDDGSTDETLDEMVAQTERRRHVRCLRLPTRQGQSAALLAGVRAARGRLVITMDGDLQYFAEDLPRLVDELSNCDVVAGIRRQRADPMLRRASARLGNWLRRAFLGDPFVDIGSGLKGYRREWLKDLPPFDGLHRFLPAIVAQRGARVQQIDVDHRPRRSGKSKYGLIGPVWRSIFDIYGVRWCLRRQIVPSAAQERVHRPADVPEASASPDAETTELPRTSVSRVMVQEDLIAEETDR